MLQFCWCLLRSTGSVERWADAAGPSRTYPTVSAGARPTSAAGRTREQRRPDELPRPDARERTPPGRPRERHTVSAATAKNAQASRNGKATGQGEHVITRDRAGSNGDQPGRSQTAKPGQRKRRPADVGQTERPQDAPSKPGRRRARVTPLVMLSIHCRDCDGPYQATAEAITRTGGTCPFCGAGPDRQKVTRRET